MRNGVENIVEGYRMVGELSRGAVGPRFEAVQLNSGRRVSIERVRKGIRNAGFGEMAAAEKQLQAQVAPLIGISQIIEMHESNDFWFVYRDLATGGMLTTYLGTSSGRLMTEQKALYMIKQVVQLCADLGTPVVGIRTENFELYHDEDGPFYFQFILRGCWLKSGDAKVQREELLNFILSISNASRLHQNADELPNGFNPSFMDLLRAVKTLEMNFIDIIKLPCFASVRAPGQYKTAQYQPGSFRMLSELLMEGSLNQSMIKQVTKHLRGIVKDYVAGKAPSLTADNILVDVKTQSVSIVDPKPTDVSPELQIRELEHSAFPKQTISFVDVKSDITPSYPKHTQRVSKDTGTKNATPMEDLRSITPIPVVPQVDSLLAQKFEALQASFAALEARMLTLEKQDTHYITRAFESLGILDLGEGEAEVAAALRRRDFGWVCSALGLGEKRSGPVRLIAGEKKVKDLLATKLVDAGKLKTFLEAEEVDDGMVDALSAEELEVACHFRPELLRLKNSQGQNVLYRAAQSNRAAQVAVMLQKLNESNIAFSESVDCDGWTPLMTAVIHGASVEIVSMLSEHYSSVVSDDGDMAILLAVEYNRPDACGLLWKTEGCVQVVQMARNLGREHCLRAFRASSGDE